MAEDGIGASGIDTNVFNAHSFRSGAMSKTATQGVSMQVLFAGSIGGDVLDSSQSFSSVILQYGVSQL